MLANITISNFIIFDNIEVDFFNGFNAFTGETGAGKSMIIDAVLQLLGEKASRNFVGNKSDIAVVKGLFFVKNKKLRKLLEDQDIDFNEDEGFIISRKIYKAGRSTAKINGTLVNVNFLKDIREYLIDIHGQYEQQSILDKEKHILILDEYIKDKLKSLTSDFYSRYKILLETNKEIKKIETELKDKDTRIEFLEFQIKEIEKADLKEKEEDELFTEHKYLSNVDRLNTNLKEGSYELSFSETSIIERLNNVIFEISKVSDLDPDIKDIEDALINKYEELKDISYDLRMYIENIDLDPNSLNKINQRLSTINELKRKYRLEVKDIIKKKEDSIVEVDYLKGLDKELQLLIKKKDILVKEMEKMSSKIHKIRVDNKEKLELEITKELEEINMKNVTFKVDIKETNSFNERGKDKIEFLISTNPGSRLDSFSNILSGGEISRIMLALKSILNKIDEIPTMIFDEIDTGISGKTAFLIGKKIKKISEEHQVICITHSPQVAANADHHFRIEKFMDENKAESKVEKLSFPARVEEVARLLSGDKITKIALENSHELIINSNKKV